MNPLELCLNNLTVAQLKPRLNLVTGQSKMTRKADIIDFLKGELLSAKLENYWKQLNKLEQAAVAHAIYTWEGDFYDNRFLAKFGELPGYFAYNGSTADKRSALALFFYNGSLASELATACKEFTQRPQQYVLKNHPENDLSQLTKPLLKSLEKIRGDYQPELKLLAMESIAANELQAIIQLIENGKITVSEKTNLASAASIKNINAILTGGDFYSEQDDWDLAKYKGGTISPIRSYAWPLLLQCSGLVKRNGSKLQLTAKGKKIPTTPIADTMRLLYERWYKKGLTDEFRRIDVIKGQAGKGRRMANVFDRRMAIEDALMACPENEWIAIDDFFRFVLAEDFNFDVVLDYWRLYISDRNYGSLGYGGGCGFELLQGRYILVYLFEYLATLGMIDVAYLPPYFIRNDYQDMWGADELYFFSRYDGLLFFRLNPLGSYCLKLSAHYQAPKQHILPLLYIDDSLTVTLQRAATPSEKMTLDQYLKPETDKTYHFDQDFLFDAIEKGGDLKAYEKFLIDVSEQKLSKQIQDIIAALEERCNAFTDAGNARILNCSSSAMAKMLATNPNTGKHCFHLHDKLLVIPEKSTNAFQKAVKKLGYIVPKKSLG